MTPNILVLFASAFIPMIFAMIWYHPKVMGERWRLAIGMDKEEFGKPPKIGQLLISMLMYFLLAFGVYVITVHQTHVLALTGPDPEALKSGIGAAFMAEYGNRFQTSSHGLAHGILAFIAFAFPFVVLNVVWEKRTWSYLLVETGYWLISLLLMAVVISNWGGVPVV